MTLELHRALHWRLALSCLAPMACLAQSQADCALAPGYREIALLGEQRDSLAGAMVAELGDINGDGITDFAVNAPQYSFPEQPFAGLTFVLYGNPNQQPIDLDLIGPDAGPGPQAGFSIVGGGFALAEGQTIRAMGDLDGDGIDDFAIANFLVRLPGGEIDGAVYFFYGQRASAQAPAFPSLIDLQQVPSGIYGEQIRMHLSGGIGGFGTNVQPLGDTNGDGRIDFALGLPPELQTRVYFGQPGRPTQINPALVLHGTEPLGNFGRSLGGGFDFDGDSINDLLACGPNQNPAGTCYLLWGASLQHLPTDFFVDDLRPDRGGDGSLGVVINGGETGAGSVGGGRILGTLDINGDGHDDLVLGAPRARPYGPAESDPGRVYVVYGSSTPPFVELSLAGLAQGDPDTAVLGFVLEGPFIRFGQFGQSLAPAGDVNDDGIDDLLIAAPGDPACGGNAACGSLWVIMGRPGARPFPPLTVVSDEALAGGRGYRVGPNLPDSNEQFGSAVTSLRDFTGDGKPEWLVGARTSRVDDAIRGKACIYLSSNGLIFGPPPTPIAAGSLRAWLTLGSLLMIASGVALRRRS